MAAIIPLYYPPLSTIFVSKETSGDYNSSIFLLFFTMTRKTYLSTIFTVQTPGQRLADCLGLGKAVAIGTRYSYKQPRTWCKELLHCASFWLALLKSCTSLVQPPSALGWRVHQPSANIWCTISKSRTSLVQPPSALGWRVHQPSANT